MGIFHLKLLVLIAVVKASPKGRPLIVGGTEATPHEFPWIVSVQTAVRNFHLCGGVILDPRTILTSAYCADRVDIVLNHVLAGKHNLTGEEEHWQKCQISTKHLHPDYAQENDYSNDIAILKINPPLKWSQSVAPIAILQETYEILQESGTIAGWGTEAEENIILPDTLHKAQVKIIENEKCQEVIGSALEVEDGMVCISPLEEEAVDSCAGDEGGPLLVEEDGEVALAGIISFGIGCGRENVPSFCTRISPYIEFIRQYMEN